MVQAAIWRFLGFAKAKAVGRDFLVSLDEYGKPQRGQVAQHKVIPDALFDYAKHHYAQSDALQFTCDQLKQYLLDSKVATEPRLTISIRRKHAPDPKKEYKRAYGLLLPTANLAVHLLAAVSKNQADPSQVAPLTVEDVEAARGTVSPYRCSCVNALMSQ